MSTNCRAGETVSPPRWVLLNTAGATQYVHSIQKGETGSRLFDAIIQLFFPMPHVCGHTVNQVNGLIKVISRVFGCNFGQFFNFFQNIVI